MFQKEKEAAFEDNARLVAMLDAIKVKVTGSDSDMLQYEELFDGLSEKLGEKVLISFIWTFLHWLQNSRTPWSKSSICNWRIINTDNLRVPPWRRPKAMRQDLTVLIGITLLQILFSACTASENEWIGNTHEYNLHLVCNSNSNSGSADKSSAQFNITIQANDNDSEGDAEMDNDSVGFLMQSTSTVCEKASDLETVEQLKQTISLREQQVSKY